MDKTKRIMKTAEQYKLSDVNVIDYGKDNSLAVAVGHRVMEEHGNITTAIHYMGEGEPVIVTHYNDEQRKQLIELLKKME